MEGFDQYLTLLLLYRILADTAHTQTSQDRLPRRSYSRMAEETSFERYTSYGRGGAGNLRMFYPGALTIWLVDAYIYPGRPSAVEEATKKLASMAEEGTLVHIIIAGLCRSIGQAGLTDATVATKPRRSSTWSMNSNGERRGSIASLKNLFRRGSNAEEVEKIEE